MTIEGKQENGQLERRAQFVLMKPEEERGKKLFRKRRKNVCKYSKKEIKKRKGKGSNAYMNEQALPHQ